MVEKYRFVKENMSFTADNDDPRSTLMFTMLNAFARFERSLIKERQRGLLAAGIDMKNFRTSGFEKNTLTRLR